MNFVFRMIPMLSMMGIIFFLSHQPAIDLDFPLFVGADKLVHACIYGVLAATVIYALSTSLKKRRPFIALVCVLLIAGTYGLSDEFHQSFIVGRTPEFGDLLADIFGAFIACLVWFFLGQHGHSSDRFPKK